FKPGEYIAEEKISELLNFSRTPIREAFHRLSNDGLVQLTPQKSARVSIFSDKDIQEIGIVRLSQDMMSARLAIYYGSLAGYLSLNPIIEKCETAHKNNNLRDRVKADMEFHMQITKIGGNAHLIRHQENLFHQVYLIQYQLAERIGLENTAVQIHQHRDMVQALMDHDINKACRIIASHLKEFYMLDPLFVSQFEA
ncbi:MAG TPA: GntR family transcriptional regulator, partial [Anaerovoracaceae bacterium]|nr:GntR family transcriptional regulator [Anaerovoracaceae bacterium]